MTFEGFACPGFAYETAYIVLTSSLALSNRDAGAGFPEQPLDFKLQNVCAEAYADAAFDTVAQAVVHGAYPKVCLVHPEGALYEDL